MRRARGFALAGVLLLAGAGCGSDGADGNTAPSTTTNHPDTPGTPATTSTEPAPAEFRERFGTLGQRSLGDDVDGRNTTAAVESINRFGVDIYRAVVAETGGNTVVGPYSISFTLGMLYAGANGATAEEIATVLHADGMVEADWHEGINSYDLTLDARTAGSPTEWAAANKVWTAPGLPLPDAFLDVLTGSYGAPVAEVDFIAAEAARQLINDWVDGETASLIPELFPEGSITADTSMVLVNAIALDAPWEFPFDPRATWPAPFTRADGSVVEVPTMHYDEYLPSYFETGLRAVRVPYGGGALAMTIIVPDDLEAFEASLTAEELSRILGSPRDGGIHLSMPKWSARTALSLNDSLRALGMTSAFDPLAADFSGMGDPGALTLVQHQAFVEVDEEGTRAAAATGGVIAGSHGPTVTVDRPFLYVVHDQGSGAVLFIGRVVDPSIPPA